MRFYALRHGKTTWNEEGRILGRTPGELSAAGLKAAELIVPKIVDLSPDIIYCSPLNRARQTIAPSLTTNPTRIEYTDQLMERDFGNLEGQYFDNVDWDGFWGLPSDSKEYNAESLDEFNTRIAKFVLSLEESMAKIVLAVTHIGVMNRFGYLESPFPMTL